MERVSSKRAGCKRFPGDIASLGIAAAIVCFVSTAAVAPAHAQISQTSQTVVKIPSPSEHDTFGYAVAVSGNTMVVGAQGGDGVIPPALPTATGLTFDTGAAYIYERINGNTVIIGAPKHTHPGQSPQSGAVYVFEKVNGAWIQKAELHSPTPSTRENIGIDQSISISGNTIVVGDPGDFFNLPAVDVFTRTNGVWQNTATLQVPDDFLFFPTSVAIDGDTVVAGSAGSDGAGVPFGGAGAAYVFALKNGRWTQQATLAATDPSSGGAFGFSVSVKNSVIAVGATGQPGTTGFSGAAYVFTGEEGVWTQKAKLQGNDSADFDQFGNSVSVSGETVLVGADQHSVGADLGAGAAYVFTGELGQWKLVAEVSASDVPGGLFAQSVAIHNGTLVIGAPFQNPAPEGYAAGEVYVYQVRDN